MLFSNEVTFWHVLGVRKPASLWERRHGATHITSLRVKTTNKVKREPGKEMGGLQASVRDPFPGLQIVKALGLCPPASPGQPQHGACSTSHGRGLSRATNGDKEAQQRSRGTPERMAAAFLWLHPLFLRWLVIMCPLQLKNLNKTVTCLWDLELQQWLLNHDQKHGPGIGADNRHSEQDITFLFQSTDCHNLCDPGSHPLMSTKGSSWLEHSVIFFTIIGQLSPKNLSNRQP